ncbi:hypothetical protein [Alloscardovia omnicolens]|uniref:hypothetical protein n=1 Tax=Alloscardovia omnicolens TaxID=419015 RepID=UPI003A60AE1E
MRTYFLTELRHQMVSPYQIMFSILMPIFMLNIFGHSSGSERMLSTGANVSAIMLIQIAFYSAVLASTMSGSLVARDREAQWTRTMYLAGVSDYKLILCRFGWGVCASAISTTLLYIIAASTGAVMPVRWWLITWFTIIAISTLFSGFGQFAGSIFSDHNAGGIASGIIVLLAFVSDIFIPLQHTMFTVAQFMPLFGFKSALTGVLMDGHSAAMQELNATFVWINVSVWSVVLIGLSYIAVRLSRRR